MISKIKEYINNKNFSLALDELKKLSHEEKEKAIYLKLLAHVSFMCNKYDLSLETYEKIFSTQMPDTRAYLEYTKILISQDNNEQAKTILLNGYKQFPKHTIILRTLINLMRNTKDTRELEFCKKLYTLDTGNINSHKLIIDALLRFEHMSELERYINIAIFQFSETDFLMELIKYHTLLKNTHLVLKYYYKLKEKTPENYIVYIGLYRTINNLNKPSEAVQELKLGLDKVTNKISILNVLVNHYIKLQTYHEAEKYARQLLSMDNSNIKVYTRLSYILNKEKKYQESRDILDKAVNVVPDYMTEIHCARAELYEEIKYYTMAKNELLSALTHDKKNTDIQMKLLIIYLALNQFSDAKQICSKMLKKEPTHKKAQIYSIAIDREEKSYLERQKAYTHLLQLNPITEADYDNLINLKMMLCHYEDALELCQKKLHLFPITVAVYSKIIIILLKQNKIKESIKEWHKLLEIYSFDIELIQFLNESKSYMLVNEKIQDLHTKTSKLLEKDIKCFDFKEKRIAILGGSNSIIRDGWAPFFQDIMSNYVNTKVDNYGLGGISSLYGLFLSKEKKLFKKYDIVIFEYTLNDIFFDYSKGYDYILLQSVLLELVKEAKKYNSKIVFNLMSPLDNLHNIEKNECKISTIYRNIIGQSSNTLLFDTFDLISLDKYSSSKFADILYRDNMHYTSNFAQKIGATLAYKLLRKQLKSPQHTPSKHPIIQSYDLSNITLILPHDYNIIGSYSYIQRESTIISYNFLRIDRESTIQLKIPKGKRVLGLLINSSENTGYIKIDFQKKTFIKNIFADRPINDPDKARIYLKQFTQTLKSTSDKSILSISTAIGQIDFDKLEKDITVYSREPKVSLKEQELEIAGVLIA